MDYPICIDEAKLTTVDPQERNTWKSGVRSAMCAASQLPGWGPTDVDDAPAHYCIKSKMMMMMQNGCYKWFIFYSPTLKRGGGAIMDLGCLSFRWSVPPSVRHTFVSAQYLEYKLIDFHHILYMHSY